MQQLKYSRQKEKEWLKLQGRKAQTRSDEIQLNKHKKSVQFEKHVVLLEAASRNDIAEVAQLLNKGVTPDASNMDGLTALHQCCIDNNLDMLKLLIDFGANVNARDSEKWTPLHACAAVGHLSLVKVLIESGADLMAVNADGNMPYDICDDGPTLDFIENKMSQQGITQDTIDQTRASLEQQMLQDLQELTEHGYDFDAVDQYNATLVRFVLYLSSTIYLLCSIEIRQPVSKLCPFKASETLTTLKERST